VGGLEGGEGNVLEDEPLSLTGTDIGLGYERTIAANRFHIYERTIAADRFHIYHCRWHVYNVG